MKASFCLAALIASTVLLTGCGGAGNEAGVAASEGRVGSPDPAAQLEIARSIDEQGVLHTLVLRDPSPDLQSAFDQQQQFIVVSTSTAPEAGSPTFVPAGDVAVQDWRFVPFFSSQAGGSILLVKHMTSYSIADLVERRDLWSGPEHFNNDPAATELALTAWVERILAGANSADPSIASAYAALAATIQDVNWVGFLIVNPSLPSLPTSIGGRSSNLPSSASLMGEGIGAPSARVEAGVPASPSNTGYFGLVNYPRATDSPVPGLTSLTAEFRDSALVRYAATFN